MTIEIELDTQRVHEAFKRLSDMGHSPPRKMWAQLGEALTETTKARFRTSRAPDGSSWVANSFVTLQRKGNKRPLIGESRSLSTQIFREVLSDGVAIGSTVKYAAVHQFGARKGQFGKTRRGAPIPWGDIPARPFLGISSEDEQNIERIVSRFFREAWA